MEEPVNVSKAKWLTRINTDKHTDVKFEIVIMILNTDTDMILFTF